MKYKASLVFIFLFFSVLVFLIVWYITNSIHEKYIADCQTNSYISAFSEALSSCQKACEINDGNSCFNLGYLFSKGEGIKQDYGKANYLFEKACILNSSEACNKLGYLYLSMIC